MRRARRRSPPLPRGATSSSGHQQSNSSFASLHTAKAQVAQADQLAQAAQEAQAAQFLEASIQVNTASMALGMTIKGSSAL